MCSRLELSTYGQLARAGGGKISSLGAATTVAPAATSAVSINTSRPLLIKAFQLACSKAANRMMRVMPGVSVMAGVRRASSAHATPAVTREGGAVRRLVVGPPGKVGPAPQAHGIVGVGQGEEGGGLPGIEDAALQFQAAHRVFRQRGKIGRFPGAQIALGVDMQAD